MKRIIVVGAGIIGASIAYSLARNGADVTVLDAEPQSGGRASPASWAWINASWGNDRESVEFRMHAMACWRSTAEKIPALRPNWCGSMLWDLPKDKLLEFAAEHASWGYPVQVVTARDILEREPSLRNPPELAVQTEIEGAIEPRHAVDTFLSAAKASGAHLILNADVTALNTSNGHVTGVSIGSERLDADEVVIAAGTAVPDMLKQLGLSLNLKGQAGLLIHTQKLEKCLNGIVLSPALHVRQTAAGSLIAGSDFGGTDPADDPAATASQMLEQLRGFVSCKDQIELDHFTIGFRPTPGDGLPVIGRLPAFDGAYIAVMHSGVTLAPAVGEIVASEILHARRDPRWMRYRPERLLQ
jgi:glycine/D-amino acid oxidase-like deaminating enzyme